MRLGREVVFIDDAMLFPTHVSLISQSKASRTMAAVAQGGPRGPRRRSVSLLFSLLWYYSCWIPDGEEGGGVAVFVFMR